MVGNLVLHTITTVENSILTWYSTPVALLRKTWNNQYVDLVYYNFSPVILLINAGANFYD